MPAPGSQVLQPVIDDIYELATAGPSLRDVAHRTDSNLKPVTQLDWYDEMSKLVLDINDRIAAAADEWSHRVIIRRLPRALDEKE